MRAPLLLTAVLALAGCGNNDQTDNTVNIGENLTAEDIVSNDVTAIDAVTGDAANMAADVDMNFGNLDQNLSDAPTNAPASKPRPAAKKPSAQAPSSATNATAGTTTNAE
ncbi:MAG: hypothetical protein ACJ8EP_03855 [Sphingomicrobium sp.]